MIIIVSGSPGDGIRIGCSPGVGVVGTASRTGLVVGKEQLTVEANARVTTKISLRLMVSLKVDKHSLLFKPKTKIYLLFM